MASIPDPEHDWIAEEAERVLNHPAVRKRIEEFERQLADGTLRTVPHEEVRRRFGLDGPGKPAGAE